MIETPITEKTFLEDLKPVQRDALVAEHIMGWERVTEDPEQPDQVPYLIHHREEYVFLEVYYPKIETHSYPAVFLPPYSTNRAAA